MRLRLNGHHVRAKFQKQLRVTPVIRADIETQIARPNKRPIETLLTPTPAPALPTSQHLEHGGMIRPDPLPVKPA
jgi:hypothetical protein